MRRYLIVANQTLAEAELMAAIRERLDAGPSHFHVLVPNTASRDLASRLARLAPLPPSAGAPATDLDATDQARSRLGVLLSDLRQLNADADGELGDPDPVKAVEELLERQQFDEIVISTLPETVSRWLGMDLPHRLQRHSGLPVTTIIAKA